MKSSFAASEALPFAKTGGLADVAGGLPAALIELGHDVRMILPNYRCTPLSGLNQIYRLKYEIFPIVGLNGRTRTGDGFRFNEYALHPKV